MPMSPVVIAILVFLVTFVFAFVMRAAALSVYKTTGVNMLHVFHKVIWYVQIVALILLAVFELPLWTFALVPVAAAALHAVLGRKAGWAISIVLGILEAIGGVMAAGLIILMWILNLAMKISDMGSGAFPDLNGAFSIGDELARGREERAVLEAQYEVVDQQPE